MRLTPALVCCNKTADVAPGQADFRRLGVPAVLSIQDVDQKLSRPSQLTFTNTSLQTRCLQWCTFLLRGVAIFENQQTFQIYQDNHT